MIKKINPIQNNYQLIHYNGVPHTLSNGNINSVQLAICMKSKKKVAIKKICRKLNFSQHPNIIKILDYYFDQYNQNTYIILEYAPNGSLSQYISQNRSLDKKQILKIFISICEAVQYMHSHNIIHRDIKPQNILLDKDCNVKLCDFGFATEELQSNLFCGTPQYMAPEMLLRKMYNNKIDIWSLGILYYQLIEGQTPFSGLKTDQVLTQMKKRVFFSNKFDKLDIDIIQYILKLKPQQRPSICQILRHDIFHKTKINIKSERSTVDSQKKSIDSRKMRINSIKNIQETKIRNPRQIEKIQAFNNINNCLIDNQEIEIYRQKISLKTKR